MKKARGIASALAASVNPGANGATESTG